MKKIFIESKYGIDPKITQESINALPDSLVLLTTVQYADIINDIKEALEKSGKTIIIPKTHQEYPAQILGCNVDIIENIPEHDAFLFIGDGDFHPIKIAFKYKKPVYKLDPYSGNLSEGDPKRVETYHKKKKGMMLKFLTTKIIGILFTTKYGQNKKFEIITKLKEKYPDKEFYTFLADEINLGGLENFPFIESWINTACPRIEEDFKCVNVEDLL